MQSKACKMITLHTSCIYNYFIFNKVTSCANIQIFEAQARRSDRGICDIDNSNMKTIHQVFTRTSRSQRDTVNAKT
jgi:hypothetical protein